METTISLKEILSILKKRISIIVLLTLIAALVSTVVTYYFITPTYQSSTQILVNQEKGKDQAYDINLVRSNIELINTYSVIIKSPVILEKVIEELKLNQNVEQLTNKITVSSQENSQVFSVTVEDSDPSQAVHIANTIANTFKNEVPLIMKVDNVSILSKALLEKNPVPIKPNPVLTIVIAMILGLMLGTAISFFLEYLDNTIKSEQEIETILGLPVIGTISKMEPDTKKERIQLNESGVNI